MRLLVLLGVLAPLCQAGELLRDDFSRFPNRIFSEPVKQLTNALHEYHYVEHRGVRTAPWENALLHEDVWTGGDEDGKTYLEMHVVNDRPYQFQQTMIIGDAEWFDYAFQAKVRPLLYEEVAGLAFRYHTNRHHYQFVLTGGNKAVLRLRLPLEKKYRIAEYKVLGEANFKYDMREWYTLRVENQGPKIRASINGKVILEASDGEILKGKVGLLASVPARFTDAVATVSDATGKQIEERIARRDTELARLRAANPQPRLWKRFVTPGFGAGRNVRFGDLDGDGQMDMLIAQHIRKAYRNAFDSISCLTAVTLDGRILWQTGRPDEYNDVLANDTPFQIHDIDGDGRNEVVMVKDFKIQVLDGRTGKLKQWAWMPEAPEDNDRRAHEREVGDSIAFFNLSGGKGRHEILIKDRYRTFWVFDNKLKQLWRGQCLTGHYPYPVDVNGDGKEEVMIGYSLFSHDGRLLWSRDKDLKDHADGVVMGNFSGDPKAPMRGYIQGSDEGYVLVDTEGRILKHVRLGHAQSPSIGKFRPDLPGLQLIIANFWRNPGIVSLFDHEGNILAQEEPVHHASPLAPVNWRGDGQEFALLSANVREGGMLDGQLRRVVMFPDDGHPDLAYYVADVTGDARDEVIVWDARSVWIYTQDRPFTGSKIYAPVRNPDYNESNYRTTVSMPGWKAVR
jgi:rhamnogalacturonan endolyase